MWRKIDEALSRVWDSVLIRPAKLAEHQTLACLRILAKTPAVQSAGSGDWGVE